MSARANDDATITRNKVVRNWVNAILATLLPADDKDSDPPPASFTDASELSDGVVVVHLLQHFSSHTIKHHASCRIPIQRADNWNTIVAAMSTLKVPLPTSASVAKDLCAAAQSLDDGDAGGDSLLAGLMWALVMFFHLHIHDVESDTDSFAFMTTGTAFAAARTRVTAWLLERVARGQDDGDVEDATLLQRTMADGKALYRLACELGELAESESTPMLELDDMPDTAAARVDAAMTYVATHHGIPRIVDVADIIGDGDDSSSSTHALLLYLGYFRNADPDFEPPPLVDVKRNVFRRSLPQQKSIIKAGARASVMPSSSSSSPASETNRPAPLIQARIAEDDDDSDDDDDGDDKVEEDDDAKLTHIQRMMKKMKSASDSNDASGSGGKKKGHARKHSSAAATAAAVVAEARGNDTVSYIQRSAQQLQEKSGVDVIVGVTRSASPSVAEPPSPSTMAADNKRAADAAIAKMKAKEEAEAAAAAAAAAAAVEKENREKEAAAATAAAAAEAKATEEAEAAAAAEAEAKAAADAKAAAEAAEAADASKAAEAEAVAAAKAETEAKTNTKADAAAENGEEEQQQDQEGKRVTATTESTLPPDVSVVATDTAADDTAATTAGTGSAAAEDADADADACVGANADADADADATPADTDAATADATTADADPADKEADDATPTADSATDDTTSETAGSDAAAAAIVEAAKQAPTDDGNDGSADALAGSDGATADATAAAEDDGDETKDKQDDSKEEEENNDSKEKTAPVTDAEKKAAQKAAQAEKLAEKRRLKKKSAKKKGSKGGAPPPLPRTGSSPPALPTSVKTDTAPATVVEGAEGGDADGTAGAVTAEGDSDDRQDDSVAAAGGDVDGDADVNNASTDDVNASTDTVDADTTGDADATAESKSPSKASKKTKKEKKSKPPPPLPAGSGGGPPPLPGAKKKRTGSQIFRDRQALNAKANAREARIEAGGELHLKRVGGKLKNNPFLNVGEDGDFASAAAAAAEREAQEARRAEEEAADAAEDEARRAAKAAKEAKRAANPWATVIDAYDLEDSDDSDSDDDFEAARAKRKALRDKIEAAERVRLAAEKKAREELEWEQNRKFKRKVGGDDIFAARRAAVEKEAAAEAAAEKAKKEEEERIRFAALPVWEQQGYKCEADYEEVQRVERERLAAIEAKKLTNETGMRNFEDAQEERRQRLLEDGEEDPEWAATKLRQNEISADKDDEQRWYEKTKEYKMGAEDISTSELKRTFGNLAAKSDTDEATRSAPKLEFNEPEPEVVEEEPEPVKRACCKDGMSYLAGKPASGVFTIYANDEHGEIVFDAQLRCIITDSKDKKQTCGIYYNAKDGSFKVMFTPTKQGRYSLAVTLDGEPVTEKDGTPITSFQVRAHDLWDGLELSQNEFVKKILAKHGDPSEIIVFSDFVTKINKRDKEQKRILMLTGLAVYNLMPVSPFKLKRRIELKMIECLFTSDKTNEFVLHVPGEYDYRYKSARKMHIEHTLRTFRRALEQQRMCSALIVKTLDGKFMRDVVITKDSMASHQTYGKAKKTADRIRTVTLETIDGDSTRAPRKSFFSNSEAGSHGGGGGGGGDERDAAFSQAREVSGELSYAGGPGVSAGLKQSKKATWFHVYAFDHAGKSVADAFPLVHIAGPFGVHVHCDVANEGDGVFRVTYAPVEAGEYQLSVKINGTDVRGKQTPSSWTVGVSTGMENDEDDVQGIEAKRFVTEEELEKKGGDNCFLSQNAEIINLLYKQGADEFVMSEKVTKINRRGKAQPRVLVIAAKAIYTFVPGGNYKQPRRRIAIDKLTALTTSAASDEFVMHVPGEYDVRFSSPICEVICEVIRRLHATMFARGIVNSELVSTRVADGDMRERVRHRAALHENQNLAAQMSRREMILKVQERREKHLEGYLKKKSPKTVGGVEWFQNRYFVLDVGKKRLVYFKNANSRIHSPLGFVLFEDVVACNMLSRGEGCRFDVHIGGKKMFALLAPSKAVCQEWVEMICGQCGIQVGSSDGSGEDGEITGDTSDVIVEGYLRKKSPKGIPGMHPWQVRYFVLDGALGMIRYFKEEGDYRQGQNMSTTVTPLGVIPLGHSTLDKKDTNAESEKFRFDLDVNRRKYKFCASSYQEWLDWVTGIERMRARLENIDKAKGADWLGDDWGDADDDNDEYCPIVLDNGAGSFKAGFGGEFLPTVDVPSIITKQDSVRAAKLMLGRKKKYGPISTRMKLNQEHEYAIGTEARNAYIAMSPQEISDTGMMVNGQVWSDRPSDWEDVERAWAYCFDHLHVHSFDEHPLLITQPILAANDLKETMTEILFEKFNVPALFVAHAPSLPIYSYGRTTGLVLDMGKAATQACPVVNGYAIERAMHKSRHLGGAPLTDQIADYLNGKERLNPIKDMPAYQATPICNDIKERLGFVCTDHAAYTESLTNMKLGRVYTMPNGRKVPLHAVLFRVGELMFEPQRLLNDYEETLYSVPQLVAHVLDRCPIDARAELCRSIVLSGGGSLMTGFPERLERELKIALPDLAQHIKVHAEPDRAYSAWTGGSILSGLDDFQSSWHLKYEYEEAGGRRGKREGGGGRTTSGGQRVSTARDDRKAEKTVITKKSTGGPTSTTTNTAPVSPPKKIIGRKSVARATKTSAAVHGARPATQLALDDSSSDDSD